MTTDPAEVEFESRLTEGTARFMAHIVEHAFAIGRRTSRDFLRHFPPSAIMEALKDSPSLRADILESTTGTKRKVALKKSAASAGEDLQIALDEGEAAADEVVRLFRPDDRIRYLPRAKLWSFLVEDEFWKSNKSDKAAYDRAQKHVAFLLDRALKDQVLSHRDIVEGISIVKLCQLTPRTELEVAMSAAVIAGRAGQSFSDRDLYDSLSAAALVIHIPLPHIWDEVIQPCALEHGLVESSTVRAELPPSSEEMARPVTANTNDQPQARPSIAKPVGPVPVVKRPQMPGVASVAAKPAPVSVKASQPVELAAAAPVPAEDDGFDVHFDNLTASKG